MSNGHLRYANQIEIIRSEEKDRYIIQILSQQFDELYTKLFGLNSFHIYQPYLHRLSEFLYYSMTTLSNRQTIGEEYVCLIQYDPETKRIPTVFRRILMVLIKVFGDLLSKYIFSSFIIRPLLDEYFQSKCSSNTIELISRFVIKFLQRIHQILFYLTGSYYNFGKTLTQIRYLIYTRSTSDSENLRMQLSRTMKFISFCLFIQSLVESYFDWKEIVYSIIRDRDEIEMSEIEKCEKQTSSDVAATEENNSIPCPLCYEQYNGNAALVPECGHVFCWLCIHTWVADNQTCPLCKTVTSQSRIVHLINY